MSLGAFYISGPYYNFAIYALVSITLLLVVVVGWMWVLCA